MVAGLLGGIVLGTIRLTEPFFFSFLKVIVLKNLCCGKDEKGENKLKIKDAEDNLNKTNIIATFLLSSMNVKVKLLNYSVACSKHSICICRCNFSGKCRNSGEENEQTSISITFQKQEHSFTRTSGNSLRVLNGRRRHYCQR